MSNQIGGTVIIPASSEMDTKAMESVEAKRELRAYFFQLRTPQRYQAAFTAGLLRDGDDALPPQVMWAEVFRRAEEEHTLAAFWTAVASHTPAISSKPNPFKGGASA